MKFTINLLKKFLKTDLNAREISIELTKLGLEFKSYTDRAEDLSAFKVAHILEVTKHPDADKLKICVVDTGSEKLQIVCGASNARAGIKVVLAPIGAIIPNGNFAIRASEIRGIKSNGMLCSSEELLISGSGQSDGIIELDNDAEIGSSILPYLGLDDVILEVEVTPNRSDCFGVYGIARDLAAKKLGILNEIVFPVINTNTKCSVIPEIKADTRLFSVREIKNLKNIESPIWLKNLLRNVGMEPVSAIVDITNYFSVFYGRPMHAYDRSKIGNKLIAHNLTSNVSFKALNDKTYELSDPDLVISDEKNVLCIAGVIGGEASKCTEDTTNIILESNVFDEVAVTTSGRKHNIITDSRSRFERGIDHDRTIDFLNLATQMIIDICGGEASEVAFVGSVKQECKKILFCPSLLEKRIGIKKSNEEIREILSALGFIVEQNEDKFLLTVPSWRHDVNIPEVIAEEIARIVGYDKIEMTPLSNPTNFARLLSQAQRKIEDTRKLTASIGYNEVITWSFMSSKLLTWFGDFVPAMQIENPISSDLDYMRPSIIPNLILAAQANVKRSVSNIQIFEIGPIFKDQTIDGEQQVLSAFICGEKLQKTHCDLSRDVDIFDVKADLERAINDLGFSANKLQLDSDTAPKYYHPTRSGSYKLGKQIIAYFGELHPNLATAFDIKSKAYIFELFLENLPLPRLKYAKKNPVTFSPYQKISRDFAFLVDEEKKAGEILRAINSADNLIKEAEIFDLYKGEHLQLGKKSIAIRIKVQADDRTLTDAELELLSTKVINLAKEKFSAELRS